MTVFIDDMFAQFRQMSMCHMIADTADELHAMAATLGIRRQWHQGDHYDVSKGKRDIALRSGAKAITWRECALMTVLRRRDPNAPLVTPEEGMLWLRDRRSGPA